MSKAYELGLYEKAMPGTLTWKERLEACLLYTPDAADE